MKTITQIQPEEKQEHARSIEDTVMSRGGGGGFLQTPKLPEKVRPKIRHLLQTYFNNTDPETLQYVEFTRERTQKQLQRIGRAIPQGEGGMLTAMWSGNTPGDIQLVQGFIGRYKDNADIGTYLIYKEETSICTAAVDTSCWMGVREENPLIIDDVITSNYADRITLHDTHFGLRDPQRPTQEREKKILEQISQQATYTP